MLPSCTDAQSDPDTDDARPALDAPRQACGSWKIPALQPVDVH